MTSLCRQAIAHDNHVRVVRVKNRCRAGAAPAAGQRVSSERPRLAATSLGPSPGVVRVKKPSESGRRHPSQEAIRVRPASSESRSHPSQAGVVRVQKPSESGRRRPSQEAIRRHPSQEAIRERRRHASRLSAACATRLRAPPAPASQRIAQGRLESRAGPPEHDRRGRQRRASLGRRAAAGPRLDAHRRE